ncbi:MAG TPA: efflux RND transporter periplasmic adaptor subunit [Pirellulales bacterium]|nr:efflux RND transporter periplasmic adaptor subunit [Pirellulales bacterium]
MKKISIVTVVLVCGAIGAGAYFASEGEHNSAAVNASERVNRKSESESDGQTSGTKVEVAKPHRGGIARTTTQPGTVMSFESARLFSKVSGYLKQQILHGEMVDIGTHVKKGDLLAVIDMPELEKEVQRDEAEVEQAKAHIVQAKAHVESAKADYEAAEALIGEREADVEHADSTLNYRVKQYERIYKLVQDKAVDAKLLDEAEEHRDAAKAGLSSAKASVVSAKAGATAAHAKIDQAEADLEDAKAKLEVAKATLEKDRVFLDYTQIYSPYNGVVTFRGFFPGEFINARDQGGMTPLLTVDRIDKMRVVLQVPDLDVPYVNKGDEASVEIDALPGRKFPGHVARVSNSEDPQTRTMRTEVDLENDKNLLRDGMYGKVTIFLEKASDALSVPSGALVGESESGKGTVYVVRGGKAHKVEVTTGADDGIHTEIISGLNPEDDVVVKVIRGAISNGIAVAVVSGK